MGGGESGSAHDRVRKTEILIHAMVFFLFSFLATDGFHGRATWCVHVQVSLHSFKKSIWLWLALFIIFSCDIKSKSGKNETLFICMYLSFRDTEICWLWNGGE